MFLAFLGPWQIVILLVFLAVIYLIGFLHGRATKRKKLKQF